MQAQDIHPGKKISRSRFHQVLFASESGSSLSKTESSTENLQEIKRRWIRSIGGADDKDLDRRLEWDGLTSEIALQRLKSNTLFKDADLQFYLEKIAAWLKQAPSFSGAGSANIPVNALSADNSLFGELWNVVASGAMTEFCSEAPVINNSSLVAGSAVADLTSALKTRLAELAGTALYHEFNRFRNVGAVLFSITDPGQDDQAPGRALYFGFLEQIRADGLDSIFREYPVLSEFVCTAIKLWKETTAELLSRIADNLDQIRRVFSLPGDTRIFKIVQNLSDPHSGGRSVAIIYFSSSANHEKIYKIVYKPRGMRMEFLYQQAVKKIPSPEGDAALRSLRVIAIEDYGFVEFVERAESRTDDELSIFYRNAGRLLAFLHLMGCTDCHYENLIAAGDQLVLIDTETLLEGRIPLSQVEDDKFITATKNLAGKVNRSVIRTGLLPHWAFWGNGHIATDISALGIDPPQEPVQKTVGWMNMNTDNMILGTVDIHPDVPGPSPVPPGFPNRLNDFTESFCRGFEAQMEAFIKVKEQWTGEGGILDSFNGVDRRIVLRSTRIYHAIKMQLIEPLSLRSYYRQGFILEQLGRAFLRYEKRPKYWRVFQAEAEAMACLDIPLFTIKCNEVHLNLMDGTVAEEYLEQSGTELARSKFLDLGREQVDFQLNIIRGLIRARRLSINTYSPAYISSKSSMRYPEPAARLNECKRIAEELMKASIREQDLPFWMAVDLGADSDKLCYGVLGPSLYSGHLGIALFINSLGRALGQEGNFYVSESGRIMNEYLDNMTDSEDRNFLMRWWRDQNPGLSGSGGAILSLCLFAKHNPGLAPRIDQAITSLINALTFDRLDEDMHLDIISGVAGLIGPLLMVHSERSIELAKKAGDRLVEMQETNGGWRVGNGKILTGFSHGAAGIIAALSRLYAATGILRYANAAEKGLAFERSVYNAQMKNWPDLRYDSGNPKFAISWCHGAPGIALSRLCLVNSPLWNSTIQEELESALGSTAAMSNNNDNLCCGLFGRSSILRIASGLLDDDHWKQKTGEVESEGVERAALNKGEYRCFAAAGSDIKKPGLFTGTAGIGLSLLDPLTRDNMLQAVLSAGLL